jgi:hypothetical protein
MSALSHHLQSLLFLNSFYLNSVRKSIPQQKSDSSLSSQSEQQEEKAEREEHVTSSKCQPINVK